MKDHKMWFTLDLGTPTSGDWSTQENWVTWEWMSTEDGSGAEPVSQGIREWISRVAPAEQLPEVSEGANPMAPAPHFRLPDPSATREEFLSSFFLPSLSLLLSSPLPFPPFPIPPPAPPPCFKPEQGDFVWVDLGPTR